MTLPVRHDGRLDYAAVARELRARLRGCGLLELPEAERTMRVHQYYYGRVVMWLLIGLSVLVAARVVW
jgi:hypothetical protein